MIGYNIGRIMKCNNLDINSIVSYINSKYDANLTPKIFNQILRCKKAIGMKEVQIISEALGITVEDIFDENKYINFKTDYEIESEIWAKNLEKYPELKNIFLLIDEFISMEEIL